MNQNPEPPRLIDPAVAAQIEAAYDYRGHVTVTLADGRIIEGFLFNRSLDPRLGPPFLEVFPKDKDERLLIPAESVRAVALSGKDFASPFTGSCSFSP
ncbi:MAG: hypothetical protein HY552_06110 [Elusimicrobia bacterium]|nr:hypothetical protein [Elusimicrobiota bacterium]